MSGVPGHAVETYAPRSVEVTGLGREDLRSRSHVECPWCGLPGGAVVVHLSVRTEDGLFLAGPGFSGRLHLAHVGCLDERCRSELGDRLAAEYEDPESSGSYVCGDCLQAVRSYEDDELAALPRAPAGEPCWSCWQSLEESEEIP